MKAQEIAPDARDTVIDLGAAAAVAPDVFGTRAATLARLKALGLPVPDGVALGFPAVAALGAGAPVPPLPLRADRSVLLALRSSPAERAWGGATAILNIGLSDRTLPRVAEAVGRRHALDLFRRFVKTFAVAVDGADAEAFEALTHSRRKATGRRSEAELDEADLAAVVEAKKARYAELVGRPFPEDPDEQLDRAVHAMARAWHSPTARILRQAKGAPEDAGLGLIVQAMAIGIAEAPSGAGVIQMVDGRTGAPAVSGSYLPDAQGPDVRAPNRPALPLTGGDGAAGSLERIAPDALTTLTDCAERAADGLGDQHVLEFTIEAGRVAVLDALPVRRGARGSVRIAVDLARRGAISHDEALLRVEPRNLVEHLHPAIDPAAHRDVFASGLAASPGAATGRIVFTAEAAQAAAAQDEACILVRIETSPEDIRGMHAARGVLTMRGGMSSHAAVIARGLGLPCVVGASDLKLDFSGRTLTTADGRVLREGAVISLDGTKGEVMAGAPKLIAAELDGAFSELLAWADAVRRLGVRANADTPAEARMARDFGADGLGLCRTEHMFFEEDRITVMREMILADSTEARRAALDRLLPMQRADFEELFAIMRGLPVTIRLLDPPLHEFLPHGEEEMAALARSTGHPVAQIKGRAAELSEINPMLGMRGVRLGITIPEIYEMQARAIFEAAARVNREARAPVVPEIMIPLVSANREVELVKSRVDAVARAVEAEQRTRLHYEIGVMVETPRAALRAGDLAASSAFLSFGTNDLTQMTYGLSRDDAGRFMRSYVNAGVFAEDPFHSLDVEGVGELMLIAAKRGRARNPDLVLGLCGEHGGDPASVQFCKLAAFDYVSCSPFRVPIARLAAAQATILAGGGGAGPAR